MPFAKLTKRAAALAMQPIAQDILPEIKQIVNMNPGGVFTLNAKVAGRDEESHPWKADSQNLIYKFLQNGCLLIPLLLSGSS